MESVQFWESVLRESSKKSKLPSRGQVLVVGDRGVGKASLIQNICATTSNHNNVGNYASREDEDFRILYYDYFSINDEDEGCEELGSLIVNMWSVHEESFKKYADIVLNGNDSDKLIIIVAIDLSRRSCIKSLKKWLKMLKVQLKDFPSQKSFRMAVAGCKSDLLQIEDVDSINMAKLLQGELRTICLKESMPLIFTSSKSKINTTRLRSEILQLLYSIKTKNISIKDGTVDIIIPLGLDSISLIKAATDFEPTFVNLDEIPESNVVNTLNDENITDSVIASQTIQDEQEWLSQLKNNSVEIAAPLPSNPSIPLNSTFSQRRTSLAETKSFRDDANEKTKPPAKRSSVAIPPVKKAESSDAKSFFENLLVTNTTKK